MLTPKLLNNFMESLLKLYEDGLILKRSNSILQKVDIDDLNSFNQMLLNLNKNLLSTHESLPKSKKMILIDKLNSLKTNFLNSKLSLISEVESTSKGKALQPFWTKSSLEKSKSLWLPTKTDFVALDLISSNSSVKNLIPNLPFSQIQIQKMLVQNSLMISWQLSQSSPLDTTVKENIRYSRKIPIYTSKQHKILFKKCFDTTRYFYNKAVYHSNEQYNKQKTEYEESKVCLKDKCETELLDDEKFFCKKHKKSKLKWKIDTSFMNLRKEILVSDKELGDKDLWQKEVPYDTRQLAIKSYTSSLKAALSNYKNGNIKHFRMGYKKKKSKKQICFINKRAINDLRIFKTRLDKAVRVPSKYKIYRDYKPESDCILMKEYNKYYLLIPKSKEIEYKKAKYDTVSLDPGRNTFQTFYSPNGVCGKLGDNWYLELEKMCKRIDHLQSLRSKVDQSSRKRRGLEIRHWKLRTKMKNVVSDMHWKMCDYLTKSYKNIIISDFMTSKMISYSKLNRDLRVQSHYKFKCKLDEKCKGRQRNLIITTEEYTSKTCGRCGTLNDVGLKRVFTCNDCGLKIDRDYNGARNILLKYIS